MLDRAVTSLFAVAAPTRAATEGSARAAAHPHRLGLGFLLAIGTVTVLGFGLRLYCAGNDLWTDEIWSLRLVHGLRSPGEVFWGISHDNNHYLNSLWLYVLGPGHSARLYRLPAVLFGTLSVLAAARLGLRRGPASSLATAALVATSYLLVNYGSEARGYSGMVLALLIALDSFDRAIDASLLAQSRSRDGVGFEEIGRQRWIFGVTIGIGTLSHLTLIGALPVFGMAMVLRQSHAGLSPIEAGIGALAFIRPALIMVVPAILCVASGIVVRGGLEFGDTVPFELGNFLRGFGDMLRIANGVPEGVPLACIIGVTGLLGLGAARAGHLDPTGRALLIAGLALMPVGMALVRLPNLQFARYFLISAVVLVMAQGRVFGAIWDSGGRAHRAVAAIALAALLLGQIAWTSTLVTAGRGSYGTVLDLMVSEGRPLYSSNAPFVTQSIIEAMGPSRRQTFGVVAASEFCRMRPDWHIAVNEYGPEPPERLEVGPEHCRASFTRRASFPTSALSGMRWTLYGRSSDGRSPIIDSMR